MSSRIRLRTGIWSQDRLIDLAVPSNWDVDILRPKSPPPLTDSQTKHVLNNPGGRPSLETLIQRSSAPVVIIDDLNRPTPIARIMPHLLHLFSKAGISKERIRILVATGAHGPPPPELLEKKLGKEALGCKAIIHDCFHDVTKIGRTSFGTPVLVNNAILEGDLTIGIGGIYPNHTAGIGGGTKLALGVLGIRSIYHLHFCHQGIGWGSSRIDSSFRQDLDEISNMIGITTFICVQIDFDCRIVKMYCGDPKSFYAEAVQTCVGSFRTPRPGQADVVISNAYPNDLSLTFAQMKGFYPLHHCKRSASRVAIAACPEGLGLHHVFPLLSPSRSARLRHFFRLVTVMNPSAFLTKLRKYFALHCGVEQSASSAKNRIILYHTENKKMSLQDKLSGLRITGAWGDVLNRIRHEQGENKKLKVVVYACASLQCFENDELT